MFCECIWGGGAAPFQPGSGWVLKFLLQGIKFFFQGLVGVKPLIFFPGVVNFFSSAYPTLTSPPPQPSILRSIQHVRKCKERLHPPHPSPEIDIRARPLMARGTKNKTLGKLRASGQLHHFVDRESWLDFAQPPQVNDLLVVSNIATISQQKNEPDLTQGVQLSSTRGTQAWFSQS